MLDRIRRKASISVLPRERSGNDSNESSARDSHDAPLSENSSYMGHGSRTAKARMNVAQRSTSYDHSSRAVKLFRRMGGESPGHNSSAVPPLPHTTDTRATSTSTQWNTNGSNTVFKSSRLSPFFRQHSHSASTSGSRPRGHIRSQSSFGPARGLRERDGQTITPVAPPPPMTKEDEEELYRILSAANRDRRPSYGQQRAAAPTSPRAVRPFKREGIKRSASYSLDDSSDLDDDGGEVEVPRPPVGDVSDTLYDGESRGLGITLAPPRKVPFTGRRRRQDEQDSPPASPPPPPPVPTTVKGLSPRARATSISRSASDDKHSTSHHSRASSTSSVRRRKPVPTCTDDGAINGSTPEAAINNGTGTTHHLQSAANPASTNHAPRPYPLRKTSSGTPSASTAMSQMEVLKPSDFSSSSSLASSSSNGGLREANGNTAASHARKRPTVSSGRPSSPFRRTVDERPKQQQPEPASPTPTFGGILPVANGERDDDRREAPRANTASPSGVPFKRPDSQQEVREDSEIEQLEPERTRTSPPRLQNLPSTTTTTKSIPVPAPATRTAIPSPLGNGMNKYLDPELTPTAEHYNVLEKFGLSSPSGVVSASPQDTRMLLMQNQEAHERRLIALMKRYNAKVQEACQVILEASQRSDETERRRSVSLFLRPTTAGRGAGGSVDEGQQGRGGSGKFNTTRSPGLKANLDRAELPALIMGSLKEVEDLNEASFERRNELLPSMLAHLIHTHFYHQVVDTFCFGAAGKSNSGALAMQLVQGLKSEVPLQTLHTLSTTLHTTLLHTTPPSSLKSTQSTTLTSLQSHLCTLIYWAGLCKRKSDATMYIARAYGRLRDALGLLCEVVRGTRGEVKEGVKELAGIRWYEIERARGERVVDEEGNGNGHNTTPSHAHSHSDSWISDDSLSTGSLQSTGRENGVGREGSHSSSYKEDSLSATANSLQGLTTRLQLTAIKLPSGGGGGSGGGATKPNGTSPLPTRPQSQTQSLSHFSDDTLSASDSSASASSSSLNEAGTGTGTSPLPAATPSPAPSSAPAPSSMLWSYDQFVAQGARVLLA